MMSIVNICITFALFLKQTKLMTEKLNRNKLPIKHWFTFVCSKSFNLCRITAHFESFINSYLYKLQNQIEILLLSVAGSI